jgi:hypothetical protein
MRVLSDDGSIGACALFRSRPSGFGACRSAANTGMANMTTKRILHNDFMMTFTFLEDAEDQSCGARRYGLFMGNL